MPESLQYVQQRRISQSSSGPASDVIVVECDSGSGADGEDDEDPAALSSPGFALPSNDKPNFSYDLPLSDPRSSIRKDREGRVAVVLGTVSKTPGRLNLGEVSAGRLRAIIRKGNDVVDVPKRQRSTTTPLESRYHHLLFVVFCCLCSYCWLHGASLFELSLWSPKSSLISRAYWPMGSPCLTTQ